MKFQISRAEQTNEDNDNNGDNRLQRIMAAVFTALQDYPQALRAVEKALAEFAKPRQPD